MPFFCEDRDGKYLLVNTAGAQFIGKRYPRSWAAWIANFSIRRKVSD